MKQTWHYTKQVHLPKIWADGVISLATAFIDLSKVKPVIWCSTNPNYEETVRGGQLVSMSPFVVRTMTREETHQAYGLARIEVTPESVPHNWRDYKRLSGESGRVIRRLA